MHMYIWNFEIKIHHIWISLAQNTFKNHGKTTNIPYMRLLIYKIISHHNVVINI
jgi:hypothetical protein